MEDMRFSDIDDKLFDIGEDLSKLRAGLTTYNGELVGALGDHIALHLSRPFYEIALDYTYKAQQAINDLMQHVQNLHHEVNNRNTVAIQYIKEV